MLLTVAEREVVQQLILIGIEAGAEPLSSLEMRKRDARFETALGLLAVQPSIEDGSPEMLLLQVDVLTPDVSVDSIEGGSQPRLLLNERLFLAFDLRDQLFAGIGVADVAQQLPPTDKRGALSDSGVLVPHSPSGTGLTLDRG
ncbi:MAG: hypothetical protein AB8G26_03205, partial [Ilumatobacter sp.]